MDVVKRNLFWLVLAGVLVLTLAFYLAKARPVRSRIGQLAAAIHTYENNFTKLVTPSKDIPEKIHSANEINVIRRYRKQLDAETEAVRKKLLERQFSLSKANFNPPPPQDEVNFREWLMEQYEKRDAAAGKAGLIISAETPALRGDYDTTTNPAATPEERELVQKRFYITREVLKAFAGVKVEVTEKVPVDKTPGSREKETVEKRGIEILDRLQFMTPKELSTKRRGERRFVGRAQVGMPPAPELVAGRPYREHLFEIKAMGHFSAIPKAVQALDRIGDFILVVRRIDITPVKVKAGGRSVRGAARSEDALKVGKMMNVRKREAVVSFVLECAVIEYDFDGAIARDAPKKKTGGGT